MSTPWQKRWWAASQLKAWGSRRVANGPCFVQPQRTVSCVVARSYLVGCGLQAATTCHGALWYSSLTSNILNLMVQVIFGQAFPVQADSGKVHMQGFEYPLSCSEAACGEFLCGSFQKSGSLIQTPNRRALVSIGTPTKRTLNTLWKHQCCQLLEHVLWQDLRKAHA